MSIQDTIRDNDNVPDAFYFMLKAGRDKLSNMRLQTLARLAPPAVLSQVVSRFEDPSLQAVCLRWFFRLGNVEKAIRKTELDHRRNEAFRLTSRMEKQMKDVIG